VKAKALPTPHASRGMAFEAALEYQHNLYAARGVALLHKVPTPIAVGGRRTGGSHGGVWERAWPVKQSIADYLGVWTERGGRALAVEAKEAAGLRWPFDRLPEHQREFLSEWTLAGGLALVVLRWTATDELWVLDWPTLRAAMSGSARSLRRADGSPGAATAGTDYLGAYARAMGARRCASGAGGEA
jgi:recombination protein U